MAANIVCLSEYPKQQQKINKKEKPTQCTSEQLALVAWLGLLLHG